MTNPVDIKIPIRWADMDAFGHVNHVTYLRYFEMARMTFFEQIPDGKWQEGNVKPIIVDLSCQYKKPVTYPDTLTMRVWIEDMGACKMTMKCEMHSQSEYLAAIASCEIVMFDFDKNFPTRIPKYIKDLVYSLQQTV